MESLKVLLKIFVGFIGIIIQFVLFILIIDYLRINIFYQVSKNKYIEAFDIQGRKGGYVPQGMAYSSKYNVVLQTSYDSNHDVSMLYVIDFSTGSLIKSLKLISVDGNIDNKHVGGITTDDNIVWITNDYEVDEFSLEEIINTPSYSIKSLKNTKLYNRGDFCLYDNGILWIGDFYLKPFYNVPDNNPLLIGYDINNLDYSSPSYIISLPKMVQGMAIVDGRFVFSRSYTYLLLSSISVYDNPLNGESSYYSFNGKDVPYYKFSKKNLHSKYKVPPMVEGIFYKDDYLYMLFESDSDHYVLSLPKIDKVLKFRLK